MNDHAYTHLVIEGGPALPRNIRGYQSCDAFLKHGIPKPELGHDGLWFYRVTPKGMRLLAYWPPRDYDPTRTQNPGVHVYLPDPSLSGK